MREDYSKLSQEDYDRILLEIISGMTPATLIAYPGVMEILSEELNNDVLAAWDAEQPGQEDLDVA